MNAKIKELKKQAMVETVEHYCWGDPAITRHLDEEKFAELIIRECINLTLDYKSEDYYNGWLDYRDKIKQHFGIENHQVTPKPTPPRSTLRMESGNSKYRILEDNGVYYPQYKKLFWWKYFIAGFHPQRSTGEYVQFLYLDDAAKFLGNQSPTKIHPY